MKPRIYVETSIVSYLTAFPSRDLLIAAHQQSTRVWWATRNRYELFTSQLVIREASAGDPDAAARRIDVLKNQTVLDVSAEATALAADMVRRNAVPASAMADALHVAIAAVNGLDYLLTWNCAHIASPSRRRKIETVCLNNGIEPPLIATPEDLAEELEDVS